MRKVICVLFPLMVAAIWSGDTAARNFAGGANRSVSPAALAPAYCNTQHDAGNIALTINNDGTFGSALSVSGSSYDCFTGEVLTFCEFPIGSRSRYLFGGALWIGAVVGQDTLVSTGADGWARPGNEFHPDEPPDGTMIYRSTLYPDQPYYEDAVSHQDYVAKYADTCLNCSGVSYDWTGRPHRPLHLEVTQCSHAWSYPHAEDFVLIDYEVKNIGDETLSQLHLGLYMDADIHDLAIQGGHGAQDDISGFRRFQPATYLDPVCPPDSDVVNLAWAADNDADFGQVVFNTTPHVTATRILQTPSDALSLSFNWWVGNADAALDFGPMMRINQRDFGTGGIGTPEGDRNKYYLLGNNEFDYDQVRVATIGGLDPIWLPPPSGPVRYWATGLDTRYLLSCGPFDVEPGETLPITLAYVGGENFHVDEANFANLPDDPDAWLGGVDFSDLGMNAVWAEWVYDNPGVDTDGDGYRGEFTICDPGGSGDTIWRRGDGVPDFRATSPPPIPTFWVEPREKALYVRWNGHNAETSVDWFARENEFEGYNAYLSTTGGFGSFAKIGSYDVEDYYRHHWDFDRLEWVGLPHRFTLEDALCRYAPGGCDDPSWHPLDYSRQTPFVMSGYDDSLFYFEPILANASAFGLETPFVKRFPNAPRPEYTDPSEVPLDLTDIYLTDDGYFKYYEYEFTIDNLLAWETYWVTITSFEHGVTAWNIAPAESEIVSAAQSAVPLADPLCCQGIVGNVACRNDQSVGLNDVMVLIDHLFIYRLPLCCVAEADINQSGGDNPQPKDITLGDVAILIDYLYITGESLGLPDCP